VLSLVDEYGHFYSDERIPELLAGANIEEVEIEFRAQIESVTSAGLSPTHLDWHCLRNGGRTDMYDLTLQLAKEYHLAIRTHGGKETADLNHQRLPANDHELLDSFSIPTEEKPDRYYTMLAELPAGLTEWAIHPGLGDDDSQQIDPYGWPVRKADFDFALSPRAKEIIDQEGIFLLDYRPLQAAGRVG